MFSSSSMVSSGTSVASGLLVVVLVDGPVMLVKIKRFIKQATLPPKL